MIAALVLFAAGLSASTTGEARAEVVAPMVVTREADLAFGAIFAGSAAGSVTVSAAGAVQYDGGAQPACATCEPVHPARFAVRGEAGRAYTIQVPAMVAARGTALHPGDSAPPLQVDGLGVRSDSRPAAGPAGQLDSRGQDGFQVGGTLQVPAGLPAAHYEATVPVMVTYG